MFKQLVKRFVNVQIDIYIDTYNMHLFAVSYVNIGTILTIFGEFIFHMHTSHISYVRSGVYSFIYVKYHIYILKYIENFPIKNFRANIHRKRANFNVKFNLCG